MTSTARITLAAAVLASGTVFGATSFGVNFNNGNTGTNLSGQTALGVSNWVDTTSATGATLATSESGVNVLYSAANYWQAGSTGTPALNAFSRYLDDGDAVSGSAPAELGTQTASDGIGAVFQFTGLSAWLAANGATSYSVTIYCSTDQTPTGTFRSITAYSGNLQGTLISSQTPTTRGDGGWDGASDTTGGADAGGYRGDTTFTGLTADTVTFAALARATSVRGTIAAVTVTAIPEPSTYGLMGAGALTSVALMRRRRKQAA